MVVFLNYRGMNNQLSEVPVSYRGLIAKIIGILHPCVLPARFTITYMDDENDKIVVSCDEDVYSLSLASLERDHLAILNIEESKSTLGSNINVKSEGSESKNINTLSSFIKTCKLVSETKEFKKEEPTKSSSKFAEEAEKLLASPSAAYFGAAKVLPSIIYEETPQAFISITVKNTGVQEFPKESYIFPDGKINFNEVKVVPLQPGQSVNLIIPVRLPEKRGTYEVEWKLGFYKDGNKVPIFFGNKGSKSISVFEFKGKNSHKIQANLKRYSKFTSEEEAKALLIQNVLGDMDSYDQYLKKVHALKGKKIEEIIELYLV